MKVGAVVIGRNEGERLRRSLLSLRGEVGPVVYVDSGSRDGSPELARSLGVTVVELDPARPFTAARGRNEGAAALMAMAEVDAIQFIDGDCALIPGWIASGAAALDADPSLALVTGWRTEVDPGRNIFHAMVETEWRRPAGPIRACGGDMMVRASAFRAAGGFDDRLIVSEDEEFCLRLAERAGMGLVRLPVEMTRHDIAMSRIGEWWRRHIRSGHGFAEIETRYPGHFRAERARALVYGLALPALAIVGLAGAIWSPWALVLAALALAAWAFNWVRTARGLAATHPHWPAREAWRQAAWMVLVKVPQAQGVLIWAWRRWRGASNRLIEYK